MIPPRKSTNRETEIGDLLHHLQYSAEAINEWLPSFRATIDKSGKLPQLHVSEK